MNYVRPTAGELRAGEAAACGPPPAAARPRMRLVAWKPLRKGSLRGFASIALPIGLTIRDCPLLTGLHAPWATLPGKPQVDKEGQPKREVHGKLAYSAPLEWDGRELRDRFSRHRIAPRAPPRCARGGRGTMTQSLLVTLVYDHLARAQQRREFTPEQLEEELHYATPLRKEDLPWLRLARFGDLPTDKGSLRHDRNIIAVNGIEADYDGEQLGFEAAVEKLEKAGVGAIVDTNPSHRPGRPRWRVLYPFSRELPPAERQHMMGRLNGLFDGIFARESWTLSQAYYFGSLHRNPAHGVARVDGYPIDLSGELDEIWRGPPETAARQKPGNGNGQFHAGPIDEAALIDQLVHGRSYHLPCTRLVGKWAVQGVALIEAQRRLVDHFDAVFPPDRD